MSSYSLDFDGSNDYVTVANIGTLSSLTVEFWMYNTDSANGSRYSQMVSRGANGIGWDWAVYLIPGNTLRWVGPGVTTIDTNVIPLNTWTHIAVTCNNVQTKIYINGTLIRTQSTTNAMTNQTSSVMFGNDVSLSRPYKGLLSEIRIWNIIRSDSDISTSYNTNLVGNETGLIGYYKLNSTSGSTAVDTSSSARNGTLSNFTLSGATSNWVSNGPPVGIAPTIGALATIPTKTFGTDVSFNVAAPTTNSSGAFTYSSSNTGVATLNSTTNALSFDGVNDGVALTSYPSLNSTNQLTIEGWIYTTGYSKMIVMINSTANLEIDAQGRISLYVVTVGTAGNFLIVSDSAVTLNAWVYIAVVKNDNGYNKIYVNNALVKNTADTTSGAFVAATGFSLGANVQASASYSSIRMSEFRMWTVARTAQQIADNYNIQIPSNSSGLTIYYKFNQGVANGTNTGLTTLTDSTSNNYHGTLQGFALSGTTSNWVTGPSLLPIVFTIVGPGTSTITATQYADASYNAGSVSTTLTVNGILPTFGTTFTLGPKSGAYLLADASFSLTAPTSNSSGAFSYTSDNSGVAAVIVPSPATLYSITSPANRTLSLTNFPILGAMPTWEMNIRFTTGATGSNSWRPLIGDMYNAVNGGRGWGVWVSSSNGIHFSWISNTWDAPGVSVALSTEYILKLTRTPTSLTVLLTTVSSGATQTATNTAMSNTTTYVMSVNGPVSIGGWANNGELFVGTIAYVNVTNPNSSVITNTTSNLLARYDASVAASGYTLSGSNVTQWNDLTGNGYHLIPNGTGPTATTMNSVAALNFNSGLGLTRTSVPLSTSITVFMAITYRSSLITDGGNFMHHGNPDTDLSIERYYNTSQIQFTTDSQHPAPTIITVANNTNYILVGRLNGTSREFWTYSDTVAPVYITGSSSALVAGNKTLYVGKSSGNEACNSSIGEILYYNASLSNADVSANILYLQNKWLYSRYVAWSPSTNPYVSIVSNGTANITATQVASGNYSARSVSSLLTVGLTPTFGTFTLGPKSGAYMLADVSFSLTAPTSDSSGAFRYTSDNSAVAVISSASTTSNLLARYDASVASGYTLSGSNVTQWNDLTGNGYHLAANGTGPTLTTIKSLPAFNFNSGYGLIRASVPLTSLVTVFIVARYSTNIAGYGSFMHHGHRDTDWSIERDSGTSNVHFQSSNSGNAILSAANNTNYIWIGRVVGNTREFWRYSDTVSTGFISGTPVGITPGNKTLYVGKSDVGEACNSSIGEILYYNASLSNADVSANLLYLQNKWFDGLSATGSGVTLVANGTANITATQDACGNYMSKSVSSLLTVSNLTTPTLGTFTVPSTKVYGDASFNISLRPTSDSSGAITYSSSNTGVATIDASGNWINIVSAGDVSFNATQAALGGFSSATKTSNMLRISKATPAYQPISQVSKTFGVDVSFSLSAIMVGAASISNGAYTFSSPGAYISISGDVATILEYTPSAITITASQAATTNYDAGSTTFSLLIARGTPSYQAISQITKTVGVDASFSLSAIMTGISSSDGSYTFSSATDAISISGGIATINAYTPSAVTVTASQAVTAQYNVGSTTFSLLISRRTPSLSSATFTIPSPKVYGDASFSVFTRPVSDSSGAITYTSSNTSVATIDASGNFITIVGPGDVSFNATQAETSLFNAATRTSNTLTVSKITISLAFVNPPTTKNVTDAAFTVTATGARPDAVTYSSSDLARATVNSSTGLVTLRGVGTVIITASQASTEFYNVSTATCSISIASAGTTLQGQDISSNTSFASVDLSGASLVGTTVSGVSFSSANLSNVDFSGAVITGTNFSNANISGATNLPAFSAVQKLQLLKNINNVGVGAVQFNAPISGADISSLLETPNNEVAAATFTVKAPTAVDASANKIVTVSSEDITGNKSVYIPINENETVKLNNIVYSFNGTNLLDTSGNVVTFLVTQNTPFKIYAGSIVALNIQNTLNRITILGDGLYNILHEILQPKTG